MQMQRNNYKLQMEWTQVRIINFSFALYARYVAGAWRCGIDPCRHVTYGLFP